MPDFINLTGRQFGKWKVLGPAFKRRGKTFWRCQCACGVVKPVNGRHLRSGESTQCRGCAHRTHGATNGRTRTTEYVIWASMIARCHNEKNRAYARYGGRGIVVCGAWRQSFAAFLKDVGPRPSANHSLDRFPDNDGNYEPGNVRWATSKKQNRNRSDNRLLTAFGETRCLTEWAEALGVKRTLIRDRLKRGWSVEQALTVNGPSYARTKP
jgi:hypothetical protein